jgi:hypothetical protein
MVDRLSDEELEKAKMPYDPVMYVHYDENRFVTAISNTTTISNNYYKVSFKRVEDFISGKRNFNGLTYEYFKFDTHVVELDKKRFNLDLYHMIPVESKADVLLVINQSKNQINFLLNDGAKKEIYSRNLEDRYKFYFTKKNNYHFLYETLVLSGKKLLSNPYFDLHNIVGDFSVYTIPVFNSYGVILK